MLRRTFTAGVAGLLALAAASAMAQSNEPIIVGLTYDAAKQASYYSLLMRDGTLARINEINAAGGVLGRQIKVLTEDDENNPAVAAQKVEKLAAAGAVFIFEVGSSSTGLAASRVAEELKVPNGSSANVAEALTNPHKHWYFRISLRDSIATQGLIAFLKAKYKDPTLAVIRDGTETGLVVSDNQIKFLEAAGFKYVAKEQISPGSVDVTAQALRIKAANPDVVLVTGGSLPDLANYVKAHARLGIKAPMIGNNLFATTSFPSLAGEAADGFMFVDVVDTGRPDVAEADKKLVALHGDRGKNSTLMLVSYDFAGLVMDAIKRAGAADRAKIRDALEATANYPGLVGRKGSGISFSPTSHDGVNSAAQIVVRIVKGGQYAGSVDF